MRLDLKLALEIGCKRQVVAQKNDCEGQVLLYKIHKPAIEVFSNLNFP